MSKPEINTELFQRIHDQIGFNPESHAQFAWEDDSNPCGTTRCVAGWAIHLEAVRLFAGVVNTGLWGKAHAVKSELGLDFNRGFGPLLGYSDVAERLLGLTFAEGSALFYRLNDEEAAKAVERYALKGRET